MADEPPQVHHGPVDRWFLRSPRRQAVLADVMATSWEFARRMGALGTRTRFARRFGAVGEGSAFSWPPGTLMNEHLVRIGSGSIIGPDVVLSVGMFPDEDLRPADGWVIRVGDRVNIGRRCALVGRERIDVADDVTFAPDVYVTDHNHRYADPDRPITRQWVDSAPVSIGAGSWLGTGVVVLPGTSIGRNVVVAAGSVVRGDVPDRSVAAGVPARVVRRWDPDEAAWDPPLDDLPPTPDGWD